MHTHINAYKYHTLFFQTYNAQVMVIISFAGQNTLNKRENTYADNK